mmetsp:Transcript_31476/g.70840  ORF Transcript_31476/g.70840 Transcript_31476/m.70840 type:complete len:329 (-) Transcript_31476:201-1187(-)
MMRGLQRRNNDERLLGPSFWQPKHRPDLAGPGVLATSRLRTARCKNIVVAWILCQQTVLTTAFYVAQDVDSCRSSLGAPVRSHGDNEQGWSRRFEATEVHGGLGGVDFGCILGPGRLSKVDGSLKSQKLLPRDLSVGVTVHRLEEGLHLISRSILLADLLRQPEEIGHLLVTADGFDQLSLIHHAILLNIAAVENCSQLLVVEALLSPWRGRRRCRARGGHQRAKRLGLSSRFRLSRPGSRRRRRPVFLWCWERQYAPLFRGLCRLWRHFQAHAKLRIPIPRQQRRPVAKTAAAHANLMWPLLEPRHFEALLEPLRLAVDRRDPDDVY